jgi:hypothetical protein
VRATALASKIQSMTVLIEEIRRKVASVEFEFSNHAVEQSMLFY